MEEFLTRIPQDTWPFRLIKADNDSVQAVALASAAAGEIMDDNAMKFRSWETLTPIEQGVIVRTVFGYDTTFRKADATAIIGLAGLQEDNSLNLRTLWDIAVMGMEGRISELGFDRDEARLRVARALRVLLFGGEDPSSHASAKRGKAQVDITDAPAARVAGRARGRLLFDITSRVAYTPYIETDGRVGYIVRREGRTAFLYLNPTTQSDDGVPTVFVYEGDHNDAAMDAAVIHVVVETFAGPEADGE